MIVQFLTDLSFSFTEDDYIANERDGYIELGITKTTGVKLANPVSIVVTPLTLTEEISNGISTAHTEIAAATGKLCSHVCIRKLYFSFVPGRILSACS